MARDLFLFFIIAVGMVKRLSYNIFLLANLVAIGLLFSCADRDEPSCLTALKADLQDPNMMADVDFNAVHCFAWDSLMLITSYHYDQQILEETGIRIPPTLREKGEHLIHIAFIKDNQVAEILSLEKGKCDFTDYIQQEVFSRSYLFVDRKASFFVRNSKGQFQQPKDTVDTQLAVEVD